MMLKAIKVSNNVRQMAYVASNSATVRSFGSNLSWNVSLKKSTTVTEKRKRVSVFSRRYSNGQVRALFGGGSATTNAPQSLYDVKANTIDGKDMSMADLKGKVVLFVNVASACGFTPQYADLNALYDKFKSQGFEIVAQPCNQFGGQEPGSCQVIKSFAEKKGAKFTLLEKADVNGSNQTDLYSFLKSKSGGLFGSDVKWNFEKFLVDRSGNVVKRYGSMTNPSAIEGDIKALL